MCVVCLFCSVGFFSHQITSNICFSSLTGVIVRSTQDLTLYLHKPSGDSLIVLPVDSYAREYDVPNMTSPEALWQQQQQHQRQRQQQDADSYTSSPSINSHVDESEESSASSSWSRIGSTELNLNSFPKDSYLYIFSPFNSTSIVITPYSDISNLPDPSSSVNIAIDKFEMAKRPISSSLRYAVTSRDIFAVVLLQLRPGHFAGDNDSVCVDAPLRFLDFIPPYLVLGTQFYIAFPTHLDVDLIIHGESCIWHSGIITK